MKQLLLLDTQGSGFTKKEKILYALLAAFFTTLYFSRMPVINNIIIGLIFLYSFYFNSITEKKQLLLRRPAIGVMALFYLLNAISALLSKDVPEGLSWLQLRVPLLLFPVGIGLVHIRETLKNRIMLFYISATTVAACICLLSSLDVYRRTGDTGFLYNDSLSQAIGKQSIYFAQMINMAVFALVYLLFNKAALIQNRFAVSITVFFLLGIQFLLASRTGIVVLYASLIFYAAHYFFIVQKNSLWKGAALITLLVGMAVLFIALFPKTLNRFKELQYTGYTFNSKAAESHYNMPVTADQWNGTNVRLAIWACGWELAKEHLFFGVHLGDKKQALMKTYRARHFDFGVRTQKNMHNTYLDVWCSLGITGLVVFMAGFFILPLASCIRWKDAWGIFIIAAFLVSLITETYIDRSIGCVLFSFFIAFTYSYQPPAALY